MTLAVDKQCSEATARALTDQLRQSLTIAWDLLVEAYRRRAWAALGYQSWDAYTDAELGETRLRLPREERREVVASMTEAGMSTRAIGAALGVSKNTVTGDRAQVSQIGTPDEPIDAEIVDEPDNLGDRIARELAASDETYAGQAVTFHDATDEIEQALADPEMAAKVAAVHAESDRTVLGTDGKTYTAPAKPAAPRRRPLPESFWQAAYDLTKAVERIERLAEDDRFPQNADQVATANRSDLIRAIDALQGVVNQLTPA